MAELLKVQKLLLALSADIDGFSQVAPRTAVAIVHWILEDRRNIRNKKPLAESKVEIRKPNPIKPWLPGSRRFSNGKNEKNSP